MTTDEKKPPQLPCDAPGFNGIPCVELYERVARVEEHTTHIDAIVSERLHRWEDLNQRLDRIEKDLERYRGSVGAVLLILTAITTCLKLFWADIQRFFK